MIEFTTGWVAAMTVLEVLILAIVLRVRPPRFSWKAAAAGIPLFVIYLLLYWIAATLVLLVRPGARFESVISAPLALMLLFAVVQSAFSEITAVAVTVDALEKHGPAVAIIASTLLRCLYQLVQGPYAALAVIPVGLLFATLYLRARTVWPLVVAHTLGNLVAVLSR